MAPIRTTRREASSKSHWSLIGPSSLGVQGGLSRSLLLGLQVDKERLVLPTPKIPEFTAPSLDLAPPKLDFKPPPALEVRLPPAWLASCSAGLVLRI